DTALPHTIELDHEVGEFGRGERIRTSDFIVPNDARYQAAPRPDRGARCTEPADDSKWPGGPARAGTPGLPQGQDLVRGQPDRVVADVLRAAILRGAEVDPEGPVLRLRDVVLQRDIERATAPGTAGGQRLLVHKALARAIEEGHPE